MEKTGSKQLYGLIGRNIAYSFSPGYFREKFEALGLSGHEYRNFDIPDISEFHTVLKENPGLCGLNVTIPYKQEVIPLLHELDDVARAIGAVNTIAFREGKLVGYNTDAHGFRESLLPVLNDRIERAFILGSGGASKAIAFVLAQMHIPYAVVSRNPAEGQIGYKRLASVMEAPCLLVNCTPLGTYPEISARPPVPYELAGADHIFYDLVYNPSETAFLKAAKERGATGINGLPMLKLQAEKSWSIWNS